MSEFKTLAVEHDPYLIGGLAIPFGAPDSKDLTGEYFDATTDLSLDWFPEEGRPVLYQHGKDGDLGNEVIGRQIGKSIDDAGVWITVQLDRRHRYVEHVRKLLAKGALGWSSGAMAHLVRVLRESGRIVSWPWVETSLTTTPAHPGAIVYSVKSADAIAHLAEVGTTLPPALVTVSHPYADEIAAIAEKVSRPTPATQDVIDEALRHLASDPVGNRAVVDEALRHLERADLQRSVTTALDQAAQREQRATDAANRTRDLYEEARASRRGSF